MKKTSNEDIELWRAGLAVRGESISLAVTRLLNEVAQREPSRRASTSRTGPDGAPASA